MELFKYAFNVDSDTKEETKMKKIGTALIATLILACVFIAPVIAVGPKNSKGNKTIHLPEYTIIVSNRGWRQWKTDIDRFAICLFTEGMNDQAIQAHIDAGWNGPYTITKASDSRYLYVGNMEFIWKYHDIGE